MAQNKWNDLSLKYSSPSTPAPYNLTKPWSPKKVAVTLLVLALLLPVLAFSVITLMDLGNSFVPPSTPTGEFMWVAHEDNRTARCTFDDFSPETDFNDCSFVLTIGSWSSNAERMDGNQVFFLTMDNASYPYYYSATVYFADFAMNGIIESGDYCTISSNDVPLGVQCSIHIIFLSTGNIICSASFAFL